MENNTNVTFYKAHIKYYHLITSVFVTFIDYFYNNIGKYGFRVLDGQIIKRLSTNC